MRRMIAVLLTLPLSACAPPATAPAPRLAAEGTWKSDCQPIGKNGRHGFTTTLVIGARALTATTQIYAHSNCDMPTVSMRYRGKISTMGPGGDGMVDFDHVVESITMTADHPEVVTIYNADQAGSGCGMGGGWKLGEARGVEGRFCAPWTYPVAGTKLYERAWVSGTDLRIGSFPAVWTNTAPDKRPTAPGPLVFHRVVS